MKIPTPLIGILTLITVVAVTASVSYANDGTDGVRTELKADDLAVVATGESVYKTHCAACHGANLEGQPEWRMRDENGYLPAPPHDESGHTWHHPDDQLFEITKYGVPVVIGDDTYKSNMPIYKGILSDDEIVAVLSYIKHSWPDEKRSWQEDLNGNAKDNFKPIEKKSTFLDKFLK